MMKKGDFKYSWAAIFALVVGGLCFGQEAPVAPASKDVEVLKEDVEKQVESYAKFDLDKIEKVVKSFLNAQSVSERLKYVRDAERIGPLMKKFHGGEEIQAEGFAEFNRSKVHYRGALLTAFVRIGDLSTSPIAVERLGEEKESVYLVDWESWVGHCEMSTEELKNRQPRKPVMMRVMLKKDNYYNFSFSDDNAWSCYKLTFKNSPESIYGYAKKGSAVGKKLAAIEVASSCQLKIAYPPEARSKDLVQIVDFVTLGWIQSEEGK